MKGVRVARLPLEPQNGGSPPRRGGSFVTSPRISMSDDMASTSSELPELLSLCDRIVVLCEGHVTGELSREEATEQRIMELATERPEVEV